METEEYDYVIENGGNCVMVDIMTVGFAGLQTVRDYAKLPIHAHRAMHGAITREPGFTVSMLVLSKVYRMLGVDLLHTGTAGAGKMEGGALETMTIVDALEKDSVLEDPKAESLGQEWFGMKPVMAVASGGLHPVLDVANYQSVAGPHTRLQSGAWPERRGIVRDDR